LETDHIFGDALMPVAVELGGQVFGVLLYVFDLGSTKHVDVFSVRLWYSTQS
jgi:hypothetical protein